MNPKQVKVDELNEFSAALSRNLMKDHEKRFGDRMRSVREAFTAVNNAGARLGVSVKNAWGTMDKQAAEYGMRLAQVIQDTAQNLARKDSSANFHDAGIFHEDAIEALNEIILTVRRYVPKLRKIPKPEMATLNSSLNRLERAIMDLGTALDGSPGHKLESLQRDVQMIQEKQAELARLRSEEEAERAALESAKDLEKEIQSREQDLMSLPEFRELTNYQESVQRKEDEIRQCLQPLIKPLLKLERAVAEKQGPAIDVKALRDLVDSPVETVVTGQPYATTQLLNVLAEALDTGKLEVLERKRRKAEEAIQSIKEGALDKARDDYSTLQANVQETLRQLKSKGLLDKRDELDRQRSETRSQIEALETRLKELQRRVDELGKTVAKLKTTVETQIDKVSREPVALITE